MLSDRVNVRFRESACMHACAICLFDSNNGKQILALRVVTVEKLSPA